MRSWPFLLLMIGAFSSGAAGQSGDGEQLGGRYLLTQRTVVIADIPILPDLSTETWSVSLVDLSSRLDPVRGRRLTGRGRLCHIEMRSSSSLVRTELPARLQRLLTEVELDAELIPRSNRLGLHQPQRWVVLGAQLEDPERDPLPESAADPRVVDQDGDGHPGVTVRVRGIVNGEVYVVQRGASSLEGERDAFGFHGAVRFRTEDVVVGATKSALTKRMRTRPDLARSTFVLRRVRPESGCREATDLARRVH